MVKPPLRTKSIGFKVSEEEYALLETAAQADGRTLGEWCREVILRGGSASDDPALAEIVGVRLLLVNVLRPLVAGEKLAPEAFDKMLDQISEVKHELAAKLQQQATVALLFFYLRGKLLIPFQDNGISLHLAHCPAARPQCKQESAAREKQ